MTTANNVIVADGLTATQSIQFNKIYRIDRYHREYRDITERLNAVTEIFL